MASNHADLPEAELHEPKGIAAASADEVLVADGAASGAWAALEGTKVASTGEAGGTKVLTEDGDNTCSWQPGTAEGTAVVSTGETGAVKFLREDGDGTSSWQPTKAIYGGIGLFNNAGVAVAADIGTTPVQIVEFDTDLAGNGVTAAHATDNITIVTTGVYRVAFNVTFSTASAGDAGVYQFRLHVDAGEGTGNCAIGVRQDMSGTSDTNTCATHTFCTLTAAEVLTIFVESDAASGDDINLHEMQLSVLLLETA